MKLSARLRNIPSLILLLAASAFAFTADFAPIKEGNTWVYRNMSHEMSFCLNAYDYYAQITVTQVLDISADSTRFVILEHDSGISPVAYPPSSFDTTYSLLGIKTRDSITIDGHESPYFPYSKRDTGYWTNPTATTPTGFDSSYESFVSTPAGIVLMHVTHGSSGWTIFAESTLTVENVGLVYLSSSSGGRNSCSISLETELVSFNGQPAPEIKIPADTPVTSNKTSSKHGCGSGFLLSFVPACGIGLRNVFRKKS